MGRAAKRKLEKDAEIIKKINYYLQFPENRWIPNAFPSLTTRKAALRYIEANFRDDYVTCDRLFFRYFPQKVSYIRPIFPKEKKALGELGGDIEDVIVKKNHRGTIMRVYPEDFRIEETLTTQ